MARRSLMLVLLALFLLGTWTAVYSNQQYSFHSTAQSSQTPADSLELGYSPSTLYPIHSGIPVYAPHDSIWLFPLSDSIVSVELFSPTGNLMAGRLISPSAAYLLYTFALSDLGGTWKLTLTLSNSSEQSIAIQFVNPAEFPVGARTSNVSIQNGQLNLGFQIFPSSAFNFEACLASADLNSTLVVPMPQSVGIGEILLDENMQNATVRISGNASQPFSFWYEMDYTYPFVGNLTGELVSRNIVAIRSGTAFFNSGKSATVSLTNNTVPRPGRYQVTAYFDSANGLAIEQTSSLLLDNGSWIWIGGCSTIQTSSQLFTEQESLTQSPNTWPTTLYLMYEIDGIESYSSTQLNLNLAKISFLGGVEGNLAAYISFEPLPYLSFSITPNPDILASSVYDGSLYIVSKSLPLAVQITPAFGTEDLQSQTIVIDQSFSDPQVLIPVGALNVQVMNNSAPLKAASIVVNNGFGGVASAISGSNGNATLYLPEGSYNVTVSSAGSAVSESALVHVGASSSLLFTFTSSSTLGYLPYLLATLLFVGLLVNAWVWVLRPRRKIL